MPKPQLILGLAGSCLLGLVCFFAPLPVCQGQVDHKPELLADLRAGWSVLQRLDESESTYSIRRSNLDPKNRTIRTFKTSIQIDRKPGYLREVVTTSDSEGVSGYNPFYFFAIGERHQQGKFLTKITLNRPDAVNPDVRSTFQTGTASLSYYPLSFVHHVPGSQLLDVDTFQLLAIRHMTKGPIEVDVAFNLERPNSPDAKIPTRLTLTVDPRIHYCVIKFRFHPSMGSRKEIEFTRVVEEIEGRLVCSRAEIKNAPANVDEVYEFVNYGFGKSHPDGEFFLSNYGFPEPMDVNLETSRGKWHFWLMCGALVAFLMALYFGRRTFRIRRAASVQRAT